MGGVNATHGWGSGAFGWGGGLGRWCVGLGSGAFVGLGRGGLVRRCVGWGGGGLARRCVGRVHGACACVHLGIDAGGAAGTHRRCRRSAQREGAHGWPFVSRPRPRSGRGRRTANTPRPTSVCLEACGDALRGTQARSRHATHNAGQYAAWLAAATPLAAVRAAGQQQEGCCALAWQGSNFGVAVATATTAARSPPPDRVLLVVRAALHDQHVAAHCSAAAGARQGTVGHSQPPTCSLLVLAPQSRALHSPRLGNCEPPVSVGEARCCGHEEQRPQELAGPSTLLVCAHHLLLLRARRQIVSAAARTTLGVCVCVCA